ncbi:tRNA (adenosine(37)-N6)-threonylcarbamoyltransferase complex dimerization subunit type 1 TsaB [Bacillus sp. FJAT-49736]|uniref:tRNA (adenosine(37)-N6)-threonylcarbamoyltransferase complex dimerization subunit type 1 TsaB n=1 Tax=Bacillus sp. FJAT-49736 TaxID=2833582 RepID=UPI001BC9D5C3|nr:tRNA (adenosine(37)-N6)-threonylcarbamoyltransferase complex dimerization subunit type 1 TsaB [Bacillus sp. FJAT-49736]MBS4175832.1 tRNA (adenosine(37)-N6)-threonylcarbamoyltransferase complex dimerization subunit type 1 TsaB [Bacillus sp. FJAT-49736]
MKVLAIDTSNEVLGIALLEEGKVIGEYITNLKKNHSIRVMPAIQQLLHECDTVPSDLGKIVVAKGPGSYTGVRIGVTIAKSMAWSLQIPLVGVSSLALMALVGRYFDGYLSPLFDARRGQLYTGLYRYQNEKLETVKNDTNILAVDWAESLKEYKKKILFIGNDTSIHKATLQEILGEQAVFAKITENNPRPSELALLGMDLPGEDIHSFVPNYIRLVEAEAKWLEARKNDNVRN